MRKTQLGLPLEASGQFVRDEYAKGLQLATFGFGQSMTCTPVGLASVFSALGNGGVRMEPRLIAKVGGRDTKEREAGRLFSKETADQVLGYMESVIESDSGTGKSLRIPGYRLAGKTGTAQKSTDRRARSKAADTFLTSWDSFLRKIPRRSFW